MKTVTKIRLGKAAAILGVLPVLLWARSRGPDPRYTGAPGDDPKACTACHSGALNSAGGKVEVAFPGGLVYAPGVTQRLTVTVTGPGSSRWGFQMTARLASNLGNGQAGDFSSIDNTTQVLCDDGSQKPNGRTCPAGLTVQFAEHTVTGTTKNTFTLDWTPPATDAGNVRIYVAGNAANGNSSTTGDQIYTADYTLTPGAPAQKPAISDGGVADAFNYQAGVTSAAFLSIFGQNLSTTTRTWDGAIQGNKLPTSLDGVSVTINGKPAVLSAISPGQVNVLAPNDPAEGSNVQVVVTNAAGASAPLSVLKSKYLPAFYAPFAKDGKLYATVVQSGTGEILGTPGVEPRAVRPVRPGEVVLVYGSGFGQTSPETPMDQIGAAAQLAVKPQILFGQTQAVFVDNGYMVSPGFVQFNVTVPDSVADGEYALTANIGGVISSNKVFITVKR